MSKDSVQAFIAENTFQLGYIMGEASRTWIERDPIGALTVGECNYFIERHGKHHEVIEKVEQLEAALNAIKDLDPRNFTLDAAQEIARLALFKPEDQS